MLIDDSLGLEYNAIIDKKSNFFFFLELYVNLLHLKQFFILMLLIICDLFTYIVSIYNLDFFVNNKS